MPLVVKSPKKGYVVDYVHDRVLNKNKNFICMFTGPTGSGKTYSALRMAQDIDPDFDIRNIIFNPEDFMDLIDGISKELKPGSVVLWDEMQIGMNNLEFQGFIARSINYILTTFRHRNIVLICTAPYFSFVNSATRRLFHAVFELEKIDYRRSLSLSKPLFIQVNQRTGKSYYKFLQFAKGDGSTPKITQFALGLPSKVLLDKYESAKQAFTKKMGEDLRAEAKRRKEEKEIKQEKRIGKPLTYKQQEVLDMLKDKKTPNQIVESVGVDRGNLNRIMDAIRKKGITLVKHEDRKKDIHYYIVDEGLKT